MKKLEFRFITFLIIFFVSILQIGHSQSYVYDDLGISEGMPQDIYRVIQDSEGFIWVCSENGLVKYDGLELTKFGVNEGLPENDIFNITEDHFNRLWLHTNNNIVSYIYKDSVYFQTQFENRYTFLRNTEDEFLCSVYHSVYDALDSFSYFGNINDFQYLENDKDWITLILRNYANKIPLYIESLYEIYNNREVYTEEQYNILMGNMLKDTLYTYRPLIINDIVKNEIQVYKDNTMIILDSCGFVIEHIQIPLFPRTYIKSALQHRNGDLWCCSNDEIKIIGKNTMINDVFYYPETSIYSISNIAFYKGDLVFSTSESEIFYYHDNMVEKIFSPTHKTDVEIIYDIQSIGDSILFTKSLSGLLFMESHNGEWLESENLRVLQNRTYYSTVKQFQVSKRDRNVTFSSRLGINEYNLDNGKLRNITNLYSETFDKKDNLYLYGNIDSVYFKNNLTHQVSGYKINNSSNYKILSDTSFIVSTSTAKTFVCENNNCVNIEKLEGYNIFQIKSDDKDLFLQHNQGIIKIPTENNKLKIQEIEFYNLKDLYGIDRIKDFDFKDSLIFVASINGLYSFDYKNYRTEDYTINISNLCLKSNVRKFCELKDALYLPYSENSITFEFQTLFYRDNSLLKYNYRLVGLDTEEKQSIDNFVSYNNLRPGQYAFRIQSFTENGDKSEEQTISFTIKKPYWQSFYFFLACALAIFGVFFIIYKRRISIIKNKSNIELKFAELELNALQSQMNPHFVFNALGSVQNLVQKGANEKADSFIVKFSRLMRMYLESSKSKYIPLQKEIQIVKSYFELEKLRFDNRIELIIENDLTDSEFKTLIPASLIQPFVENSINHGLFHKADKGFVRLKMTSKDSDIQIEITDDGVGRKAAEKFNRKNVGKHISRALQIIDEKINAINKLGNINIKYEVKDLFDDNNKPTGTAVIIFIKKSKREKTSNFNSR